MRDGALSGKPLLITIDDAHLDTLDVFDIFQSFDLPLAIFVCAGWTAGASAIEVDTALARLASDIEWYYGPERELVFPCGALDLSRDKAPAARNSPARHR